MCMGLESAVQLFAEAAVVWLIGTVLLGGLLWVAGVGLLVYSTYRGRGGLSDFNVRSVDTRFWIVGPILVAVVVIWGITTLRSLNKSANFK